MVARPVIVLFGLGAIAAAAQPAAAVTREAADMPSFNLTFGRSVLNELSSDTYRTPYDDLQSRPYDLLFASIARQPTLSAWPGQEGGYARYVDALIGNNGAANVENGADAIQGTMVRRETAGIAWGLTAGLLSGAMKSDATAGTASFADTNDLHALDLRGGAAVRRGAGWVLGAGLRAVVTRHDNKDVSFEPGTGGLNGGDTFDQLGVTADFGARRFLDARSSWDLRGVLGYGKAKARVFSESVDANGLVTDSFVSRNDVLDDLSFAVDGGYNRLRGEGLGETAYRGGVSWSSRKLGNSDLAYSESGGVRTPDTTLTAQAPIATWSAFGSARTIFQAGETEVFLGARLGYRKVTGSATTEAFAGTQSESIDDATLGLNLTLGLRQPLFRDKLRIVVSGHGDLIDATTGNTLSGGSQKDHATQTVAHYAVGLETVLANVTLDLAWLRGDEATADPILIGVPAGSRRTVQLDKLVLSAAVSW